MVLFHVLDDATEMKFNFQDRPTIFEDLETGEEARLYPAEVREVYKTRMAQLRKDLDVRCAQYRIDWWMWTLPQAFSRCCRPTW